MNARSCVCSSAPGGAGQVPGVDEHVAETEALDGLLERGLAELPQSLSCQPGEHGFGDLGQRIQL